MGALAPQDSDPLASVVRTYAPATGDLLAEIPVTSREDVAKTVARARKAQAAWRVLSIEERCERVLRFRDAIVEHMDEVVEVISRETGKPRHEALLHEVLVTCDLATWYCQNAARILAPHEIELHLLKHRRSTVLHVPSGVVGVISPWNFPFVIPMGDVFASLVAGNGVVVKPSEATPLVMLKAKEIYDGTGMPEDLFAVVVGRGDVGAALIQSGIQRMVFTGGVQTGKRVAAACGAELVPCVLELGGKAPLVACGDCDVERTARAIVFGGFANAGQACISVERVYAHKDVYEPLVRRVRELTAELTQGDPSRDFVDVGAITFHPQLAVAEAHVDDAVSKGAELVCGGRRRPGPGQFFEPTVLANCDHSMTVMTQEIFGPIVPIQRVASEDEAVAFANQSHLGLNAYVFTKDRARGRRLAERIEAGSVVVNDVLMNYAACEAPFGGVKQSGYGRVHGEKALRDLCDEKHVSAERVRMPARDPMWFPYSSRSFVLMHRAVRAMFTRGGVLRKLGGLF